MLKPTSEVLGPVDGGGGAHGAKAIEQTDDEEDEAFVGGADMVIFECAVLQTAADVEIAAGAAEVDCEGIGSPDRGCREKSGEDWRRDSGRRGRSRIRRCGEGSGRRRPFRRRRGAIDARRSVYFEYSVNAFGRKMNT